MNKNNEKVKHVKFYEIVCKMDRVHEKLKKN